MEQWLAARDADAVQKAFPPLQKFKGLNIGYFNTRIFIKNKLSIMAKGAPEIAIWKKKRAGNPAGKINQRCFLKPFEHKQSKTPPLHGINRHAQSAPL
jgi:hypothetical protein